jgi:DNA invertase Pin-like site-specific DNA recombinase
MVSAGEIIMKRVAFYIRVSTSKQDTENQRRELEAVADRSGWKIVKVYEDAGISGAKGRDQRPALDAMMKAVNAKEFDMVATLSVDRLGRSLTDLLGILQGLHEKGVGLFLHQQGLDTSTTAGKAMFEMLGVFAEFERGTIRERGNAGLARARANGTKPGLRRIEPKVEAKILELGANMAPYRIFGGMTVRNAGLEGLRRFAGPGTFMLAFTAQPLDMYVIGILRSATIKLPETWETSARDLAGIADR